MNVYLMHFKIALWIAQKELLEIRRDVRTLVLLVAVPALFYPLLLVGVASLSQERLQAVDERALQIEVGPEVSSDLQLKLAAMPNLYVAKIQVVDDQKVKNVKRIDAKILRASPVRNERNSLVLLIDSSTEGGQSAARRIRPILEEWLNERHLDELRTFFVPEEKLQAGKIEQIDVAPQQKKTGFLLSRTMVPLLIVMLLLGAFYPAIDMTSGERERSTLVTLLAAPVSPLAIAGGKFMAVTLLSITAAAANLMGMGLTSTLGLAFMPDFVLPVETLALMALVLFPLALYTSAILLAASTLAQTTKEAQTYLTPVFLLLSAPAIAAVLPGVQATWKSALIPVFGPALVLREILAQSATAELILAGLLGAIVVIFIALGLAARAFSVEAILVGRISAPLRLQGPIEIFDAVLLTLTLFVAYLLASVAFSDLDLLSGLWLSQGLVFFILPSTVVFLRTKKPFAVLGWTLPKIKWPVVLLVFASWPIFAALGETIGQTFFTVDEGLLKQMEALAAGLEGKPSWLLFLSFAFLPAVCEETAFRGALLSAAKRKWLGVVVVAIVFAVYHGSLIRMPITFLIGLLTGILRVQTGSIFLSVLLHLIHNGSALLIASQLAASPDAQPLTSTQAVYADFPMPVLLLSALAALMLGIHLGRSREGVRSE